RPGGPRRGTAPLARRRRSAAAPPALLPRAPQYAARLVGHLGSDLACPGRGGGMIPELVRVSPEWLRLREAADAAARALVAISVTGRFHLTPADPLDARVSDPCNARQRHI